jgi:hypothetical protein
MPHLHPPLYIAAIIIIAKALAAAMKEFEVARAALVGLEEQLSEKRSERTQENIIALEHYLAIEVITSPATRTEGGGIR